jgi:N-acetylglucosamine-6-phosphate deacetylase
MQIVSARILLADALLVDPEEPAPARGSLLLDGGRIEARLPADAPGPPTPGGFRCPAPGGSPGLIDVHHHGDLVMRVARDAAESLVAASATLVRQGVTSFLPTTLSWPSADGGRARRSGGVVGRRGNR